MQIITLKKPWANWVSLGWKQIETRTHKRLQSLVGQRIGIHVGLSSDNKAIELARPYLTAKQIELTENFLGFGGAIICTVFVSEFRELTPADAPKALIECDTRRYGLILTDVKRIEAIPCRGYQGIWNYNLDCHSDCDGNCTWTHCPQLKAGEPTKSGRHCPLDVQHEGY